MDHGAHLLSTGFMDLYGQKPEMSKPNVSTSDVKWNMKHRRNYSAFRDPSKKRLLTSLERGSFLGIGTSTTGISEYLG